MSFLLYFPCLKGTQLSYPFFGYFVNFVGSILISIIHLCVCGDRKGGEGFWFLLIEFNLKLNLMTTVILNFPLEYYLLQLDQIHSFFLYNIAHLIGHQANKIFNFYTNQNYHNPITLPGCISLLLFFFLLSGYWYENHIIS